jgi:hypothetical protein
MVSWRAKRPWLQFLSSMLAHNTELTDRPPVVVRSHDSPFAALRVELSFLYGFIPIMANLYHRVKIDCKLFL